MIRSAGILATLLVILLFAAVRASMPALIVDPARGLNSLVMANFSDPGEALIHALPPVSAAHMPLSDILAAELANHRGLTWRHQRMLSGLFLAVLIAAAAVLLKPAAPFYPAACLLLVLAVESQTVSKYMQHFYTPLVLLPVCLMIAKRSAAWRLMTALALGAGLLFRSPLAFLPPVLAALDVLRPEGRRSWSRPLIWLVPYLFLIPWAAANYAVNGKIILLEANATSPNIVGGALGLVGSTKGDWTALVDPAAVDSADSWSVWRWAAGEALSHPGRSLAALARRLRLVAGFQPLLLLAAAAGLWFNRKDPGFRTIALVAAYFILVHSLMSVQENYFTPLWPLLALLAASPAAYFSAASSKGGGDRGEENALPAVARGLVIFCLATALVGSLYTFRVLQRYARAAGLPAQANLLAALEKHPGEPWLFAARARQRWLQGDAAGALADAELSAEKSPGDPQRSLELAWARLLNGDARPLEQWSFKTNHPAERESFVSIDAMILKVFAQLRRGRTSEAARALTKLDGFYKSRAAVRGDAVAAADAALERLRAASSNVLAQRIIRLIQDYVPSAERASFCLSLTKIFPLHEHMRRLEFLGLLGVDYGQIARERGDFRRLLPLLESLTSLYPRETVLWIELSAAASAAGRREQARAALVKAESLSPVGSERLQIAFAYSRLGERRRALDLLESHIAQEGRDPVILIEEARLLLQMGHKEMALKLMSSAQTSPLSSEARHDLALLYEESGQRKISLGLFEDLVRRNPSNAVYRKDLGVSAFRSGDMSTARASLEASLRIDPAYQEARLSLGAILMAAGQPAQALKVYDEALSAAGSGHPLASALREARIQALKEIR